MRGITRDVSSWYLWDGGVAGGDGRIPFCSKPRAYPEFTAATSELTGARYRFKTGHRCEEPARRPRYRGRVAQIRMHWQERNNGE
jgi:hypothetical protein